MAGHIPQKKYVVENIDWSRINIFCCGNFYSSAEIEKHVRDVHEKVGPPTDKKNVEEVAENVTAKKIILEAQEKDGLATDKKNAEEKADTVPSQKIIIEAHEKDGATAAKRAAEDEAEGVAGKKIKPFACTFCGKTFSTRYYRNHHIQIRHGALGMRRRTSGIPKKHSSRRSSIPCRINNCAMLFGTPTGLKRHMNNHKKLNHREPKNKPVINKLGDDGKSPCAICGKRVKILSSHMKIIHRVDRGPKGSHGPTSEANQKKELGNDVHPEVEEIGFWRDPEPGESETNYNIDALGEDESTDDEYAPKKSIPKWAQDDHLRRALVQQWISCPNLDAIFAGLDVDVNILKDMFVYQKKRFLKRTSSAQWESLIPKSFKLEPQ